MPRRVGSDGLTNTKTPRFSEQFHRLPAEVQDLARSAFEQFLADPNHRSLRRHKLKPSSAATVPADTYSVSITMGCRALYVIDAEKNQIVWFWIGTHADYDRVVGRA